MRVMQINNQQSKMNIHTNRTAFKSIHYGYWKEDVLRILERSPEEIKELGEYFHKSTKDELLSVSKRSSIFGFRKKRESNWAFNVLNNAVNQVLDAKKAMQNTLDKLTQKGGLSANEMNTVLEIKKTLKSLEDKYDSRHKKFFQEIEPLGEEDIAYYDRHKWDY